MFLCIGTVLKVKLFVEILTYAVTSLKAAQLDTVLHGPPFYQTATQGRWGSQN